MNSVILMGRLGKDPIWYAAKNAEGSSSVRFNLAVEDKWKKRNDENAQPDWIPCVVFGKSADALAQYCKKGTRILVKGRLKTDTYKGENNENIYTWNVICDEWEFADTKKPEENGSYQQAPASTQAPRQQQQPQQSRQQRPAPAPAPAPASQNRIPQQQAPQRPQPASAQTFDSCDVPDGFMACDLDDVELPFN